MSDEKKAKKDPKAEVLEKLRSARADAFKLYTENLLACGPNQHADDFLYRVDRLDRHIAALERL